jgi:predicted nucleotidyltransferase
MTMQIRNQKIAGFPAVKVRNALRHICNSECFDANSVFAEYLHVTDGQGITKAMLEAGYIEPTTTPKWADETERHVTWYVFTEEGNSFTRSSGMARMPRAKAEGLINTVLERIADVNAKPYAFSVVTAAVFGSFLRLSEQTLGDLDIAVELTSRYSSGTEKDRAEEKRRRIAEDKGRRFSNIVERLYWPEQEVFKHLKAGQCYLSLHPIRDLFEMARKNKAPIPHRVIFGGPVVFPTEIS